MTFAAAKMLLALSCGVLCSPAWAEIVVVVHPKNPMSSMTLGQVSTIFLGSSSSLVPLDQPESSAIRHEFYKKVTGKELAQVQAIWSKLVFTGKSNKPKELQDNTYVKKVVATQIDAIGYIDKSALDSSVKAVLTVP